MIPSEPPTPIYLSQKTLEENVEALIKDPHAQVWSEGAIASKKTPLQSNVISSDDLDTYKSKSLKANSDVIHDDAVRRNSWAQDDFYAEADC